MDKFFNFIKGHKKEKSEAATEALDWVNSYYNSDGFKERLNKLPKYYQWYSSTYYPNSNEEMSFSYINPEIPKFNYSNYKESLYNPNNNTITIGTKWNPDDYFKIASHELGHVYSQGVQNTLKNGITFKGGHYNYYPVFRENPLYKETLKSLKTDYDKRTYQTYPDAIAEKVPHDALPAENYADLIALRAELARNGIYDSTKTNNPFTAEHLKQAREKLKNRLFDYFNDDLIILMMNDVAYNPTLKPVYAKNGIVIKKRFK